MAQRLQARLYSDERDETEGLSTLCWGNSSAVQRNLFQQRHVVGTLRL